MFSCAVWFSCSQGGSDCSSINELAGIPPVDENVLLVFGAGIEAGRCAGYLPDCVLSNISECSGRIQPGNMPSSMRSPPEKFEFPVVVAFGQSPERSVSNQAGSSGWGCSVILGAALEPGLSLAVFVNIIPQY